MSTKKSQDLANMVGISQQESQSQRVETMILEPRTFNQQVAIFDLPQQGILSDDLALQIQLTVDAAQTMDLPLIAGIDGLFDRIELYFGTTLINSVTEVAHLLQAHSLFEDQDKRDWSQQTYTGGFSGLKVDEQGDLGRFQLNALNTSAQNTSASTGITGLLQTTNTQINKRQKFRCTDDATTTPEYCLKLKRVFPILTQIPLALFALKERIRVEFHFSNDVAGNRCVGVSTAAGIVPPAIVAFVAGNNIVQASCKLSVDLIYYEDIPNVPSPMLRIQEQLNKGVDLVYTDYITILGNIPAITAVGGVVPAPPVRQSRSMLLGLDHETIRNLLIVTPRQTDGTVPSNQVLGNFESCASPLGTELQVTINNENIFPSPLNNDAKFYNETSQVFDTPLKVNRGLFSAVGQVDGTTGIIAGGSSAFADDRFIRGIANNNLQYKLQYLGVNLAKEANQNYMGNGVQIGRQPVQILLTKVRGGSDDSFATGAVPPIYSYASYKLIVFAEAERIMTIRGGNIFISGS